MRAAVSRESDLQVCLYRQPFLPPANQSAPSTPSRRWSAQRGGHRQLPTMLSYRLRSPAVAPREVSGPDPSPRLRKCARDTAVDSRWNVVVRTCTQRRPRRSSAADSSATRAASRRRSSMAARASSPDSGLCMSLPTSSNCDLVGQSLGADCVRAYDGRHSSRVSFVTRASTRAGEAGPAAAR